jgi:hypothetical protein
MFARRFLGSTKFFSGFMDAFFWRRSKKISGHVYGELLLARSAERAFDALMCCLPGSKTAQNRLEANNFVDSSGTSRCLSTAKVKTAELSLFEAQNESALTHTHRSKASLCFD